MRLSIFGGRAMVVAVAGLVPAVALIQATSAQTSLIRVAQARVGGGDPGSAAFNANVVGVIKPWSTTQTAQAFYAYGSSSFNGPVPLTDNRIHLFFAQASDGLAAYGVYDQITSGEGGYVQLTRYSRPGSADVADLWNIDLESSWCESWTNTTGSDSRHRRYVRQAWGANDTDGWAFRLNDSTWTSFRVVLTESTWQSCEGLAGFCEDRDLYSGIDSIAAMSADGSVVSLALDQRAVQFRPMAPCELVAWPSQQARCVGSTATFSARPNTSGPVTFAWYRGATQVQPSSRISISVSADALESTLSIAELTATDAGQYTCLVTSPCGSFPTSALSLNVSGGTPSTTNPTGAITVCGAQVDLGVAASGVGPFQYQWVKDGHLVHDVSTHISGSDQATLTIVDARPEHGGQYVCVVSNACGSATSAPAAVSVIETRPVTSQNPASTSAVHFGSAQFTATISSPTSLDYQWQWLSNGNWVNLSNGPVAGLGTVAGSTTATLSLSNLQPCSPQQFRLYASNACGCEFTSSATLTMLAPCCDPIDFNGDTLFPDTLDITDFITVFGGGVCDGQQPGDPPCNTDIDFNNDQLFPDTADIQSLLSVFSGGACL